MAEQLLVALAGQPNSGKSTIFNMLTGARQHVANYPGVTIEKKVGRFNAEDSTVEIVDLPGTYSLTSYSLEERVARDFVLHDKPGVIVNVADASNLKRHLFLTFQLLEMGQPVVVALNMMDVAKARNQVIDTDKLQRVLGVPVVPTIGRKNVGAAEIKQHLGELAGTMSVTPMKLDYGMLESYVQKLTVPFEHNSDIGVPARWLAIKLLENDEGARTLVLERVADGAEILEDVDRMIVEFHEATGTATDRYIEERRYARAEAVADECIHAPEEGAATMSDKADRLICHRVWGYPILFAVLYLMYYLSIEFGYEMTNYTWPILAKIRSVIGSFLPIEGFVTDPMLRSMILWLVDSVNALLNYIPIFLILFSYIAFLEDLGYMPRMAFLLDAFFRRFGLHGQSTLPLVLGGVYVGGCAVPGVMASRAVSDERARLATILVVPMMNCLAKVPLYVLLIGIYFAAHKSQALFFIATITILMALVTAKLLNLTVLKDKESAPFIMEMPPYHTPKAASVVRTGLERVWTYVRKITTVVAAVSVILFVFMQFPGISSERMDAFNVRADKARAAFHRVSAKTNYHAAVDTPGKIDALFDFLDRYKTARSGASDKAQAKSIDADFKDENLDFFMIVKPRGDKQAKKVSRAFKKLRRERLTLRAAAREEIINRSFLGSFGRLLEPVTQYAGFNWRVNVALLSALAAKENVVATLGSLYQPAEGADEVDVTEASDKGDAPATGGAKALEQRMAEQEAGFTPLHALALMLFMALYPPCMATTMVVKVQAGSWKWMAFSLAYMSGLGAIVATLIFSGGSNLGLTGLQAMAWFYGLALAATVIMGLIKPRTSDI